jgi:hypothetical protein
MVNELFSNGSSAPVGPGTTAPVGLGLLIVEALQSRSGHTTLGRTPLDE